MTDNLMAKNEWIDISEEYDESSCSYRFDNCDSLHYTVPSVGYDDMDYTRFIFEVLIVVDMKEYEYDVEVDITKFNNIEADNFRKAIMEQYNKLRAIVN